MGSLYKPKVVDYRLADGKTRLPSGKRVTKQTPGAVRSVKESSCWWGRWTDAGGNRQQRRLHKQKEIARRMLAKLEGDAAMGSVGIPTIEDDGKTLEGHLADFAKAIANRNNTPKHVRMTVQRVRDVLAGCECATLADVERLDEDRVSAFLAELRQDRPTPEIPRGRAAMTKAELLALVPMHPDTLPQVLRRLGLSGTGNGKARRFSRETAELLMAHVSKGMSVSSSNHYLTAAKAFTRWLSKGKNRRILSNPLDGASRLDAQADRRVSRRSLSQEQFHALLDAASAGKELQGMDGPTRRILYQMAARTGLRAHELATLTPASMDLDGGYFVARASLSKNRKKATLPLAGELVALLRPFVAVKPRTQPLFPGLWFTNAADMVRHDLESAGIPYVDDSGDVYDFHALRHQFISDLATAGVHPADAQKLARHSTVKLTMDVYTHVRLADLRAAVDKLPSTSSSAEAASRHQKKSDPEATGEQRRLG